MKTQTMHMNTNARIVSKVLTRNKNTFYALKELINNSIQAKATRIEINLLPIESAIGDDSMSPIEKVQVLDNGCGVAFSQFQKSILEVATDNKPEGCGVGRFSGLQIGRIMSISTVGFDKEEEEYTETSVIFNEKLFERKDLDSIDLDVHTVVLSEDQNCGYKVEISNLYTSEPTCPKRNKLGNDFLHENLKRKIFEHYPLYIFNNKIQFIINGDCLKRSDFVKGKPSLETLIYSDVFGKSHKVSLQFFNVKLSESKIRIFIQTNDGEVSSTALELTYNSMWYAPSMGAQYILIESDYLSIEFIESSILGDMNKDWKDFSLFLKRSIDEHYKKDNVKFNAFREELRKDKCYPYTQDEKESSVLSTEIFEQSAFIIEDDIKLLHSNEPNRTLIYTLLKKVIDDGDISFIVEHVMGLSKKSKENLTALLDKTNLEEIVNFSSKIAEKLQFLELLQKTMVTELNDHISYYDDMRKAVIRNLWILGDEFSSSFPAQPDSCITEILNNLFKTYIPQKTCKKYHNELDGCKRKVKQVTSSIMFNERYLDSNKKEISCFIFFAPSLIITQTEITTIDTFVYELYRNSILSNENVFKIYFIASSLNDFARTKIENSYLGCFNYSGIKLPSNNVRVYLMDWARLIEYNREKLSCASKTLKLNKMDVETTFAQEYANLLEHKNTSELRVIKYNNNR